MDQIRARSVGLPPPTGVDAEIDRLRGRDPLPPRVVPSAELADLLDGQGRDRRLVLDAGESGVRAVLALFVQLKEVADSDGSWNGGDVVAIVSGWFARRGIDPDRSVEQLDGVVTAVPARRGGDRPRADEAVREADDVAPEVLDVADG